MKIIGITGNSGSGKSTVCRILKDKFKVEIIDADKIARQLTDNKSACLTEIVEKFGNDILDEFGKLNRGKLAEIIYNDSNKREELNKITFKYVLKKIKEEIEQLEIVKVVVIDAPLLFESNLNNICHLVIGVIAQENLKIDRICVRDCLEEDNAIKRLNTQLNTEFLLEHSNYIIENNSTIEELEKRVCELWKCII